MAARLALVLCQAENSLDAGRLEDDMVLASLLMERGLDSTLIGPLRKLSEGETDQLCLSGIAGPFVLLSRTSPEDTVAHLQRLQISGRLVHHTGASANTTALDDEQRAVHFFQLTEQTQLPSIIATVRKIQADLSVQVFSLQGVLPIARTAASSKQENSNGKAARQLPVTSRIPEAVTVSHVLPVSPQQPLASEYVATAKDDKTDAELDDLLDQLDGSNV